MIPRALEQLWPTTSPRSFFSNFCSILMCWPSCHAKWSSTGFHQARSAGSIFPLLSSCGRGTVAAGVSMVSDVTLHDPVYGLVVWIHRSAPPFHVTHARTSWVLLRQGFADLVTIDATIVDGVLPVTLKYATFDAPAMFFESVGSATSVAAAGVVVTAGAGVAAAAGIGGGVATGIGVGVATAVGAGVGVGGAGVGVGCAETGVETGTTLPTLAWGVAGWDEAQPATIAATAMATSDREASLGLFTGRDPLGRTLFGSPSLGFGRPNHTMAVRQIDLLSVAAAVQSGLDVSG